VLEDRVDPGDDLRAELRGLVGRKHGKPFRPREVMVVEALPKTQSGKIVRRAIAAVPTDSELGALSSVENPSVLETLAEES